MPVENAKHLKFRPEFCFNQPCLRLNNIQNNSDAVFIAYSHRAHICVCGK